MSVDLDVGSGVVRKLRCCEIWRRVVGVEICNFFGIMFE